jgi:peptidoglycan/xylan/chitin deacetylase (PgdA/CDA1 family)
VCGLLRANLFFLARSSTGGELVTTSSRARGLPAGFVKQLLHYSGWSTGYVKMRKVSFIVTYHCIRPEECGLFKETAQFLAENFHIVPLGQLVETVESAASISKHGFVALTFDDGLRNHAEVAYPVLRELGIPATFYLCPDLIDRGASVWTWEIHSRLERLGERDQQQFFKSAGVSGDLQRIIDRMKIIPVDEREEIEKRVRDLTPDFQFTRYERDCYDLMSWSEVEKLDPEFITIGSHTATHIDLPQAGPDRLERELLRSKEILESRLNRKVQHFAYPNGSFNEAVLPAVRQFYRSAVTTRPGIVRQGDNPLLLNRIHADFRLPAFSWDLARAARREQQP